MPMKNKTFNILLALIIALGVIMTGALLIYTYYAYKDASIVSFIAREWWF